MHDGKAEAAEFGLLNKFPQHKSIPHEPRISLQHSTDTVILPPAKYTQIRAVVWECSEGWTDRQTDRQTHRHTDTQTRVCDQYTFHVIYDSREI